MRKLTTEQFRAKVQDTIILIDDYKKYRSRIRVKCKLCNFEWFPTAHSLAHGYGCPACGKEKAKETKKWNISQEDFLSKIPFDFLKTIEIIGNYTSQHGKIEVKCRLCGRIWHSTPYRLYRKCGCSACKRAEKGINSRKSHEHFQHQVDVVHYKIIKLLEVYKTGDDRIKVECLQCGHQWNPVAQRLLRRGCPYCISSKGEKKIESILLENNIKHSRQYVFNDFKKFKFDFVVFKDNGEISHLIEYDGQQHFKPVERWGGMKRYLRQCEIDKIKNDYCFAKGIKLIRISFTDYSLINLGMIL